MTELAELRAVMLGECLRERDLPALAGGLQEPFFRNQWKFLAWRGADRRKNCTAAVK
jgi:hypothetical protein